MCNHNQYLHVNYIHIHDKKRVCCCCCAELERRGGGRVTVPPRRARVAAQEAVAPDGFVPVNKIQRESS